MISGWSHAKREAGGVLLLLLLALVAYGFLLRPGKVPYSPHSDIIALHLGIKDVAYRSLAAGHGLPFWRSDLLSGGPALTHPQALFTNPFQLAFLFAPAADAVGPTLWLHLLTAGVSFWVLGAALGLGYGARGFMAVSGLFAFKLLAIAYAGWLPVIPLVSYLPLLFAAVLRAVDRPGLGSFLLLALCGSLCLHSGHLQLLYYALLLLTPYALLRIAALARSGRRASAAGMALGFAGAAALAAASAAYLLVPLAADASLTSRVDASYAFFLADRPYRVAHLLTFLDPEILGTPLDGSYPHVELWEDVAYFGIAAELLAVAGVALGRRRRHAPLLVAGLGASLLLSIDTPVTELCFQLVPGFSIFRNPRRMLFLTSLLGIALSGVGVDELLRRVRAARLPRFAPRATAVVLVLFSASEGLYYARRYLVTADREQVMPATDYAPFLAAGAAPHRVAPLRRHTINSAWAAPMDLELITGFEPYNYRHYHDYMGLLATGRLPEQAATVWTDLDRVARWDLLDALNVRYVVTRQPLVDPRAPLELVAHFEHQPFFVFYAGMATGDIYVYENHAVRPRAAWARELVAARDAADARSRVMRVAVGERAIVEGLSPGERGQAPQPGDSIEIAEARGGHLGLRLRSGGDRFLVVSEVWHPGWRALLDGREVALHRVDVALMGLPIPAGSHRLELDFRPLYWDASLRLSLAALGAFALLSLAWAGRRRAAQLDRPRHGLRGRA